MKNRFLLCGTILLCLIAFCVQAEGSAAEDAPVILQNGNEITLSLNFSGEMAGMQAVVQWDPLCLAMEETPAYSAEFKSGSMVAMLNPDLENGALNMVYLRQKNLSTEEMEVFTLVFRALDEAVPCNTEISIVDCRMTDANAQPLDCSCKGFELQIGNPDASTEPEASAEPTPEPLPAAARLYFKQVVPESTPTPVPTATPVITAEPTAVPTVEPTATAEPTAIPTVEPTATAEPTAIPTVEPTATAEPTVTPTVVPTATVEPTAIPTVVPTATVEPTAIPTVVPTATVEPTDIPTATVTPGPTPAPTPTRTPVPTAKPPAGSTGGSVSSGTIVTPVPTASPTPTPTVTPEPTIPTLVLDSTTPAPGSGSIYIRTRNTAEGFAVDLIAENVEIGGLQANIDYDASAARLLNRKFSEDFLADSMINMINDAVPGRISLVYSNVNGYNGDGSTIFTAEFAAEASVNISLNNVKYTGVGADISSVDIADQNVAWEIQPEDDLEILEEDGIPVVLLKDEYLSLTLNPGEYVFLRLPDKTQQDVYWTSERSNVVSISPEGLVKAGNSGLALLTAMDVNSGMMLGEVRICVRNTDFGLPVEITCISFDDGLGEAFALTASEEIAEDFATRGIRMRFMDEDRSVVIEGLLPAELVSIPAGAFDHCGNLYSVEIIGSNIVCVEEHAFSACEGLTSVFLGDGLIEIQSGAFPMADDFSLSVFANSLAEMYAIENGMNYNIIEQAGEAE